MGSGGSPIDLALLWYVSGNMNPAIVQRNGNDFSYNAGGNYNDVPVVDSLIYNSYDFYPSLSSNDSNTNINLEDFSKEL